MQTKVSSTLQDRHPSLKYTSPDTSKVAPIITSAAKKTQKDMKNNKVLDIDNLAPDVSVQGENEPFEQATQNFNQIL